MIYTKISVFDFVIYSGKKINRNSRNRRDFAEIYDFFVILSFFLLKHFVKPVFYEMLCAFPFGVFFSLFFVYLPRRPHS